MKKYSQPATIIKRENAEPLIEQTKPEILQTVNPAEAIIRLSKIRTVYDGGLVIACQTQKENKSSRHLSGKSYQISMKFKKPKSSYPGFL